MQRLLSNKQLPEIKHAFKLIPNRILSKIDYVDFLCEVDPIFVGIHDYENANHSRLYKNITHCAYPFHQHILSKDQRKTTIILPIHESVWTIIHELGHVLHEVVDFSIKPIPITNYAKTNYCESFAESFCAYIHFSYTKNRLKDYDPKTLKFFQDFGRN